MIFIKIKKASDSLYWYADKIGETFKLSAKLPEHYMVKNTDGKFWVVKLDDADIVEIDDPCLA